MDFTGRDTFMAASFWAWVLGPAGAMATVGVVIASATVAEEVTEAGAAKRLAVAVMRAAAVARHAAAAGQHAPAAVAKFAATQRVTIQAVHVPVQATQQLHIVAAADIPAAAAVVDMPAAVVVDMPAVAVVDMPAAVAVVDMPAAAVVVDMPAADTSNL